MRALGARLGATSALSVLLLGLSVVPALAHASFDVSTAPADTDVELTILAPLERDSTNQKIEAQFPTGFKVLSCDGPAAWLCNISTSGGSTLVTWETLAGTDRDIAFEVEVHTPTEAGKRRIPVVQTYVDGHESAWIGDGGDAPAPVLEVTSSSAAPTKNTAPPTDHTGDGGDKDTEPEPKTTMAPVEEAPEDEPEQSTTAEEPAQDSDEQVPVAGSPTDDAAAGPDDAAAEESADEEMTITSVDGDAAPEDDSASGERSTDLTITPAADDEGGSALPILALVLLVGAGGVAAWWWRTQQD